MADVKTGEDHLRSLRDGRAVYIDGERVADVTTHPAFRNAVRTAAALYDHQARPENLERLTFAPEPAGGDGYRRVNPPRPLPRRPPPRGARPPPTTARAHFSRALLRHPPPPPPPRPAPPP